MSTCAWCWDHDCCCDDAEEYDLPGDEDWPTLPADPAREPSND